MKWDKDPIVASHGQWSRDAIVEPAAQAPRTTPLIVLGAGLPVPSMLQPAGSPSSAGRFPIGRKYTVGDVATFRRLDMDSNDSRRTFEHIVTGVDLESDRVEVNGGMLVWDTMGNLRRNIEGVTWDTPPQFIPIELQVGSKWSAATRITRRGQSGLLRFSFRITTRERIVVPAGSFDAFKVEGKGTSPMLLDAIEIRGWTGGTVLHTETLWLVPYLNFAIRHDREAHSHPFTDRFRAERVELVSARQWDAET